MLCSISAVARLALPLVAALALLGPGSASAQIVVDGSLGPEGLLLPDAAGDVRLPEELGRLAGTNLFHSFARFDIPADTSATFTSSSPGIARVLARITGGTASQIDGLLRSEIPDADVFLLNPQGVVFGEGARLDLGGALYVGAARSLLLEDGMAFSTDPDAPLSLSVAAPAEWGFLVPDSSIDVASTNLAVAPGETLSLHAATVSIAPGPTGAPRLFARGGLVDLVAAPGADTPVFEPGSLDASSLPADGRVRIAGGTLIEGSGQGSGRLTIRADTIAIEDADLFFDANGAAPPIETAIDLGAASSLVVRSGSQVTSEVFGSGDGGAIRLVAGGAIEISGDALVLTVVDGSGTGNAADVRARAPVIELSRGGQLGSQTNGPGDGGDVRVDAGRLIVRGVGTESGRGTFIGSRNFQNPNDSVLPQSFGDAGGLEVAADEILLSAGGQLFVDTTTSGDAGDLTVRAASLEARGAGLGRILSGGTPVEVRIPSGIVANEGSPAATAALGSVGSVDVEAERIALDSGGVLQRASFASDGAGGPGELRVRAGRLTLSGVTTLEVDGVPETQASLVTIRTNARDGARLSLWAEEMELSGGAQVSGSTDGAGDGGTVEIAAPTVVIRGAAGPFRSGIVAQSFGEGVGGEIRLDAARIRLAERGLIAVTSFGTGDAGRIAINGDRAGAPSRWADSARVELASGSQIRSSAPAGPLATPRSGGDIELRARKLALAGSGISATNGAVGDAGNIELSLSGELRSQRGTIETEAVDGLGGNVRITARDRLDLRRSAVQTSVASGAGSGGNVTLAADAVVLNDTRIEARADAGNGGDIRIAAGQFLGSAGSTADASSRLGIDGRIRIESPVTGLTGDLVPLRPDFLDVSDLLVQDCAEREGPSGTLQVVPDAGDR